MTARVFVLIETMRDRSREVNAVLRRLDGIISADRVTPPYDIIAVAEGDVLTKIDDIVITKIQRIDGVIRTVTCATL